ncbi:MAG: DUF485 domain-containing protein [Rickettsiales bacterium]|nr:DUF485 domain-containing protein [Rickettsiales bacterium]
MIHHEHHQAITDHPAFSQLVNRRRRFAIMLTILMLVVYFLFILIIAFSPEALGTQIPGSVISIGIPIGIAIIFFAFILTGIYVHRANTEFDQLTHTILEDTTGKGQ